jgi:flagellin
VDEAIAYVSAARARLGAYENRLEYTIANLGVSTENLITAESRIRDADIAFETVQYTRNLILFQAGSAVLAQANLLPRNLVGLLV